MEDKFLTFIKKNDIDEDDVVSQLYLLILEQKKELEKTREELEKIREELQSDKVEARIINQLGRLIREDLTIGVENASIEIDYDKLAASIANIEKRVTVVAQEEVNNAVVIKTKNKGFFSILKDNIFNTRTLA